MAKKNPISKLIGKISTKIGGSLGSVAGGSQQSKIQAFKYVFFITELKYAETVSDVLRKENTLLYFVSQGMGTASSEILNLLGIGAEKKAIISCLEQAALVPVLLKEVRKKFSSNSPGQVIAFSIPLSAINDPVMLAFNDSNYDNEKIAAANAAKNPGGGKKMAKEYAYDLIISVVNNGYTDEFMNTARAAGATGGTVLHARGQTHEGIIKRFGISVQDEREIILILCRRERKVTIMQAVSEAHGLNSKACGIVFSLPVDDVMGMGMSFE